MVVRLASEARYSPSEFWSGSTAQTLTLGEILLKHLVGGEKQLVGGAIQHHLVERVAAAGDDLEAPRADHDLVAMGDAAVGPAAAPKPASNSPGRGRAVCRSGSSSMP